MNYYVDRIGLKANRLAYPPENNDSVVNIIKFLIGVEDKIGRLMRLHFSGLDDKATHFISNEMVS